MILRMNVVTSVKGSGLELKSLLIKAGYLRAAGQSSRNHNCQPARRFRFITQLHFLLFHL